MLIVPRAVGLALLSGRELSFGATLYDQPAAPLVVRWRNDAEQAAAADWAQLLQCATADRCGSAKQRQIFVLGSSGHTVALDISNNCTLGKLGAAVSGHDGLESALHLSLRHRGHMLRADASTPLEELGSCLRCKCVFLLKRLAE
eukprot:SAG11_NODE_630_length_8069_cov_2.158344_3_plen_145_part_00